VLISQLQVVKKISKSPKIANKEEFEGIFEFFIDKVYQK